MCLKCDENFINDEELEKHVKKVHVRREERLCLECGIEFRDNNSLREHIWMEHELGCMLYIVEREVYEEEVTKEEVMMENKEIRREYDKYRREMMEIIEE